MYPAVGKPHSHPSHPDYVPSVFPSAYGTSTCRSEQVMSRLHQRIEREKRQKLAEKEAEIEKCRIELSTRGGGET